MKATHKIGLLGLLGFLMTGCQPVVVPVKSIMDDRPRYLAENYSAANAPAHVVARLGPAFEPRQKFETLTVDYTIDRDSEGKKTQATATAVYTNLHNGLIRIERELTENAIPYACFFQLSFQGLVPFKFQSVGYKNDNTWNSIEVKSIIEFPSGLANPAEDTSYTYDYEQGTLAQVINFNRFKVDLRTHKFFPASDFSPALKGKAVQLDYEYKKNSLVQSHSTYTLLLDYGVAIQTSYTDASTKNAFTITKTAVK